MVQSDAVRVLIRGGGDLASAAARRLHLAGMHVVVLELAQPLVVRRTVAFAAAVREGHAQVMEVRAVLADAAGARPGPDITVVVDPDARTRAAWRPEILIDARMRKQPPRDLSVDQAPLVVGLGPGLVAGEHCHAIVETQRGHRLGRVYWDGQAARYTGVPGVVGGETTKRILRAPRAGRFTATATIGDTVAAGDAVGAVDGEPVTAAIGGILRGLLYDDTPVTAGTKVGDVDPRAERAFCFEVSDKANAVAGGVLEAVLTHLARR